jgi:hypothetical protein
LEFKSGKNSALDKKSCITLNKLIWVVASHSGQENPLLEVQKKRVLFLDGRDQRDTHEMNAGYHHPMKESKKLQCVVTNLKDLQH